MQHEVKSNPLHKDPKDAALLSAEWAAKGEPAERVSPRGLDRGSGVFDREEEAVDDDMETVQKGFLVMIQTGVTLGFAPLATLFMLTVIGDCVITSPHLYGRDSGPEKSKSMLQFINMIIFPAMSFFMSAYMMVAFWMDKSAWTMLRRCIMFANVPMICFYGLILMGQSDAHTFGTTCEFRGFLLQVMSMWHTMTVVFLYRNIAFETPKFHGKGCAGIKYRYWVHIVCWLVPIFSTVLMSIVPLRNKQAGDALFHQELWSTDDYNSELDGVGWCGVDSRHRVIKAIFLNGPQLILVSFYGQYYYYIHQYVDPAKELDVSGALGQTKITTSRNAGMMSSKQQLRAASIANASQQQRLYMVPYMVSFLLNTLLQLFSDNLSSGPPSTFNLALQAVTVTPQGFLIGLVYMRSSKNIFTLYAELIESLLAERSPHKVSKWKEKRYKLQMKREKLTAFRKAQTDKMFSAGSDHGVSIGGLLQIIWITWNTALFTPLAVWVWTPMEFLGEFLRTKVQILMGLCVWGVILVLPTYWFSLGRLADLMCLKTFAIAWADDDGVVHWPTNPAEKYTTGGGGDACIVWYEGFAEWYIVMLIFVSSVAVYKNRYSPRLLFTEGPVRREGFLAKIGMGMRLNSIRNSMGCFTMSLEFYQIWGLTWTASQMDVLYFDKSDNITEAVDFQYNYTNVTSSYNVSTGRSYGFEHWDPEQFLLSKGLSPDDRTIFEKNELLKFWVCVGMVGGWTFLYCLPHVITTTTVGNRALVFNLMEAYRGYLWFMAGAGFLTILKALVKMTFCRPHPEVPDLAGPLVAYTDYSIPCWSPEHLRYVVISLGCLCVFFPSASLTCLFRYDDDDDRGFGPRKWRSGIAGELSEEGTHIKHRPIYAHNHKRDYPVAPCLRGCVLGGEDLRWLHLWRRIEYMVKFCWVFAGYRLSQHANAVAVVLLLGSFIIAFVNARMHPSNLQYVNLWKLEIHVANVWTTMTCLYANAVGFTNENEHWIVLVSGWVILTAGLVGWEARVVANDVFLLDCSSEHPNGKRNQNRCKREARMLRRNIAYNTGTKRWATHRHITRLFRLCEHKDLTVSRAAFKEVATLAYQDQMTGTLPLPDERGMPIKGFHETNSFFLCLTPTDPWTMTMIHAITTSPDMDIRHYATQVLTAFLQMNIGNKVFAPTTFHETLVRYDQSTWDKSALGFLTNNLPHNLPDRVEGQITRDIANYAVDKYDVAGTRRASGTNSNLSAAQLIMEMCNADSNKLIVVADTMLPMLTAWLDKGSIIQQYTAVHLIAMVSNRFDLANKVINSGALASVINLFKAVHSVYGQFVDAGAEIQDDNPAKFDESRANVPSIRFDKPMPGKISVSGRQLSKGMKKLDDFMTERLPPMSAPVETQADDDESAESAVDDVGIPNEFVLDGKMLTMIQGDILHDCIQTVVELAGASRAVGRRLILEAGATDVVTTCLHFAAPQVAGVDAGIELRVHDDLLHEALRACHAFLSGRFSMEDIEFDDDFHKPYVFLIKWKETVLENEDWDAEVEVGAYLTATQRRKAHIICAFLQLEHESVGGIGKRKVMARLSEKLKPKSPSRERESMDDMNDSPKPVAVTPTSDKPQWLIEHEKGPQDNDAEDEIYAWCWTTMEATGVGQQVMELGELDGADPILRFHSVDILLKLVEHGLDRPEDETPILRIMLKALLESDSHGMALMGATALDIMYSRKGLYRPYGCRSVETAGRPGLKGKALFKWAGTMVRWLLFWYQNSDGDPDFNTGEGGFDF